jgi:hypothetical protein
MRTRIDRLDNATRFAYFFGGRALDDAHYYLVRHAGAGTAQQDGCADVKIDVDPSPPCAARVDTGLRARAALSKKVSCTRMPCRGVHYYS